MWVSIVTVFASRGLGEENGHSRIQLRLAVPSILRSFDKNTRNTETTDIRWIAAAETQKVLFGRGRTQYDAQVLGFSIRWFPAFCRTCSVRGSLLSSYPHHSSLVTSNSGMRSRSAPFPTLQNSSSRSFVIFIPVSSIDSWFSWSFDRFQIFCLKGIIPHSRVESRLVIGYSYKFWRYCDHSDAHCYLINSFKNQTRESLIGFRWNKIGDHCPWWWTNERRSSVYYLQWCCDNMPNGVKRRNNLLVVSIIMKCGRTKKKKTVYGYGIGQIVQVSSELSQFKKVVNFSISRIYLSSPVHYQCRGGRRTNRSTKVPPPCEHDRREQRRLVPAAIDEQNLQFLKFRKRLSLSEAILWQYQRRGYPLDVSSNSDFFVETSIRYIVIALWYSLKAAKQTGRGKFTMKELWRMPKGLRQRLSVILQSFRHSVTILLTTLLVTSFPRLQIKTEKSTSAVKSGQYRNSISTRCQLRHCKIIPAGTTYFILNSDLKRLQNIIIIFKEQIVFNTMPSLISCMRGYNVAEKILLASRRFPASMRYYSWPTASKMKEEKCCWVAVVVVFSNGVDYGIVLTLMDSACVVSFKMTCASFEISCAWTMGISCCCCEGKEEGGAVLPSVSVWSIEARFGCWFRGHPSYIVITM